MLRDLLGIFLRQDNLLNLEEGSADVDLMNFEDLKYCNDDEFPLFPLILLEEVQLALYSGVMLSGRHEAVKQVLLKVLMEHNVYIPLRRN